MSVAMDAYFIPETTTLDDQMREFLRRKTHFALWLWMNMVAFRA